MEQINERVLASCGGYSLVEACYPAGLRLAPHTHDIANVSLVLRGSLTEETERGVITAGPGCVVVKPAGTEPADQVGPRGAILLALRVDPTWANVASRIADYQWCSQDMAARVLLLLYAAPQAFDDPNPHAPRPAFRPRIDALFGSDGPPRMQPTQPWLTAVQASLHGGGDSPERVGDLARDHGVHRVYLARAFRRDFGSTPGEYARRARITQATHELVASDRPLAQIAAQRGFSDQAHFCRCFRSQVGMTPGAYRRLARTIREAR